MLGEKLGSIQGGTTNKTLPVEGSLPKFETTTEGSGTLAGVDVTSMATYSSEMRADGTLYGEYPNQGFIMTQDGIATFRASGIGTFTAEGGASFRGSSLFSGVRAVLGEAQRYCCSVRVGRGCRWSCNMGTLGVEVVHGEYF